MLSPAQASILGDLCSLRRFQSFFIGTHDSLYRFLKLVQSPRIKPSSQSIDMQEILNLDDFEKMNRKKKGFETRIEIENIYYCFEAIFWQAWPPPATAGTSLE